MKEDIVGAGAAAFSRPCEQGEPMRKHQYAQAAALLVAFLSTV